MLLGSSPAVLADAITSAMRSVLCIIYSLPLGLSTAAALIIMPSRSHVLSCRDSASRMLPLPRRK